jgi:hypothetical protein
MDRDPATGAEEQILALKFLRHFVGDIHQPLHASDDHDRGGNSKRVSAGGLRAGNLHRYWDTEFVRRLGPNARQIATDLNAHISEGEVRTWSQGNATAWAMGSFRVGRDDAYGRLPQPSGRGGYRLPEQYVTMATQDVAVQLSKAGIRLAFLLNHTLGPPAPVAASPAHQ